jgi:Holliday junction resolvasome RuvABC endonuclease subunit
VNVIGIDPSLEGTGLAWSDTGVGTCRGNADERLVAIHSDVQEMAKGFHLAVVEDLPTHGHGAGKTGMAQGVVRLALLQLGVPYALITPATLKKFATGKGNATKPDMRVELLKRTGMDLRDDDQVDAWWLRAMGMQYLGAPIVELPKAHLAALVPVVWPAGVGW